jgi:hypothetical protein
MVADGRVVSYNKQDGVIGGWTDTGVAVIRRCALDKLSADTASDLGELFPGYQIRIASCSGLGAAVAPKNLCQNRVTARPGAVPHRAAWPVAAHGRGAVAQ